MRCDEIQLSPTGTLENVHRTNLAVEKQTMYFSKQGIRSASERGFVPVL